MKYLFIPKFSNNYDIDWEFNDNFIKYTVYEIVYEDDNEVDSIALWEELFHETININSYSGGVINEPYIISVSDDLGEYRVSILNYIQEQSKDNNELFPNVETSYSSMFDVSNSRALNEIHIDIDDEEDSDKTNALKEEIRLLRERIDYNKTQTENLVLDLMTALMS